VAVHCQPGGDRLFGVWVVRYFVKQHEQLLADHKQSRECYQESLRGVVAEQSATNAKLVVCLDNNTKVLEECRMNSGLLAQEKQKMRKTRVGVWCGAAVVVAAMLAVSGLSGCSTLDRVYQQEVTWTNAPVVHVFTNTVVVTNTVPVVTERTNIVYMTNATTGAVAGYLAHEPVATNLVSAMVTNFVPVFYTNVVQVPVTNLSPSPRRRR